jgi:hypothetical protein
MHITMNMLKILATMALSSSLLACGGGSGEKEEQKIEQSSPLSMTITGPATAYSWQNIVYSVQANKIDAEYFCQWSLDRQTWYATDSDCSFTPDGYGISADTTVILEVTASTQTEQISREVQIAIEYQYRLQNNSRAVAEQVLLAQNQLLNLSNTGFHLSQDIAFPIDNRSMACDSQGNRVMTLNDNDGSQTISTGDELSIVFQACMLRTMEGVISGNMTLSISDIDPASTIQAIAIGLSNLTLTFTDFNSADYLISGNLAVMRQSSDNQTQITTTSEELMLSIGETTFAPADATLTLSAISLVKIENYANALIEISSNANFKYQASTGDANYNIRTTTPLQNYFGAYPTLGRIEITNSDNLEDQLYLDSLSDHNVNWGFYFEVLDSSTNSISLNSQQDGGLAVYRLSALPKMVVRPYNAEELSVLGILLNKPKLEVNDAFTVVLSRPIASVSSPVSLSENVVFAHQAEASVAVNGTKLTITPLQPLLPGAEYQVSIQDITTNDGLVTSYLDTYIQVSNSIIPVITLSQGYFTQFSTPLLSAKQSQLNDGRDLSYIWQVVESVDVNVDQADQLVTGITVGANVQQDITVQLSMSNELGDSALVQKPLRFLDTSGDYMLIIGSNESYISEAETWPLNEKDGAFIVSTIPYVGEPKGRSFISVAFDMDSDWKLQVAAPKGQELTVGEYTGATRYTFQADNVPGLAFGGQGRGCNKSFSDFTIYELSYDDADNIASLAIDFDLACEQETRDRLRGVVRINSTYPLTE